MGRLFLLVPLLLMLGAATAPKPAAVDGAGGAAALTTVAIRAHRMEAMEAFYSAAFGFRFRDVETAGMASRFGERDGLTLKLVPIRDSVDFEGYPVHQLGFTVDDVAAVISLAKIHGGASLQRVASEGGQIQAAVRDPDGNTVELYQRAR